MFKEQLPGGLKNDIKNLVNFHASSRKSENLNFDGLVLSRAYKVYKKTYRRVMSHDTAKCFKEKLLCDAIDLRQSLESTLKV